MDSFKEGLVGMLPALWVVIPIIMLLVLFKALRSAGQKEREKNKIDHTRVWLGTSLKIQRWADEHPSGRLETVISNNEGPGGEVVVVWQSLGEKPDEVVRLIYLEDQPENRIVIRTFSLRGRRGTFNFSREEFTLFLKEIEEIILSYETPLSRGGDKPNKL